MKKDELLIKELSDLIGVELEYSVGKTCDLVAEERVVVLRYCEKDESWLYFGVVFEPEGELSRDILVKALELNLFGGETLGFHLGLFGNALVLSGSVAMEGLTAESFADRILAISRHIGKLAERLDEDCMAGARQPEDISTPWGSGFMQV